MSMEGTNGCCNMMRYYEDGDMYDDNDVLVDFFAHLIKSRIINVLQGCYGRTAMNLVQAGYISTAGAVLKYPE